MGRWGKGYSAIHTNFNFTARRQHRSIFRDQRSEPPNKGSATDALVWRKYRMLGGDILQDIPKHVLITSAAVTKGGTTRTKHFALVCNSSVPLKMGGRAFRFSNPHYKNLGKDGKLGKSARGQRTTAALVRWTNSPISGAECDSLIDFSADLCTPYCVELFDPVRISPSAVAKLNQQIAHGLHQRSGDTPWRPSGDRFAGYRFSIRLSLMRMLKHRIVIVEFKGESHETAPLFFCVTNDAMLIMR